MNVAAAPIDGRRRGGGFRDQCCHAGLSEHYRSRRGTRPAWRADGECRDELRRHQERDGQAWEETTYVPAEAAKNAAGGSRIQSPSRKGGYESKNLPSPSDGFFHAESENRC